MKTIVPMQKPIIRKQGQKRGEMTMVVVVSIIMFTGLLWLDGVFTGPRSMLAFVCLFTISAIPYLYMDYKMVAPKIAKASGR